MSKELHQSGESAELRHRAEKRLKRQTTEAAGPGSAAQTQRLVHELQVHQIELEMQNEELRESRSQVSGYSGEMAQNSTAGNDSYTFLAKPFDLQTLAETIRHRLD